MRLTAALALLTLLGSITACAKDDPVAAGTSPAGTYVLSTVNGKALPQVAARIASGDVEVVSASLTLKSDETYSSTYTYRTVAPPVTTFTQTTSGTWSSTSAAVTLYPSGASPSSVSTLQWGGSSLTLVDANATVPVTLVFRR